MHAKVALGILVLLAAMPSGAAPAAADVTVTVENFAFDPPNVSINVGESVTWTWASGTHSVVENATSAEWCSVRTTPAPDCTRAFLVMGTFEYHCGIHPGSMTGVVDVVDPTAPDLFVASIAFRPDGGVQHVDVTVTNQGIRPAGASTLNVTYRGLLFGGSLGSRAIGVLPSGASQTVTVDFSTALKVGDFNITAIADALNNVAERNERNNRRSATTSVLVAGVPGIEVPV